MGYALLFLIALVVVGVYLYFQLKSAAAPVQSYFLRESVFNASERKFYEMLIQQLPNRYFCLSKIRLEDFIGVNKDLEKSDYWSSRGYIKSRHVDFLICDRGTGAPLLSIEVDGGSHRAKSRQERDALVDKIHADVGLKILHVRVGGSFQAEISNAIELLSEQAHSTA